MMTRTRGSALTLDPPRHRTIVMVLAGLVVAAGLSGCEQVLLWGLILHGPPANEPDFETQTKKSLTDRGVVVAVVCYAPDQLKFDFPKVDRELARYVAQQLHLHHIQIVPPDNVLAWLDKHDDWDRPVEIARAVAATHVIFIDLRDYTLYEPNSNSLYRGRATGEIQVFQLHGTDSDDRIYSSKLDYLFPRLRPRDTHETTRERFKAEFLSRLSEEIGHHFYEWYNGDNIPDAS